MPGSSGVKPASRSSMQMMLARFCRMHAQIGPIAHVTAGQGMVECSMAGRRPRFDFGKELSMLGFAATGLPGIGGQAHLVATDS